MQQKLVTSGRSIDMCRPHKDGESLHNADSKLNTAELIVGSLLDISAGHTHTDLAETLNIYISGTSKV